MDTLRADRLGSYGYRLNTSPNLDKFSANAILYRDCYAHSSETRPSFSSIMSGFYPHETTVRNNFNVLPTQVKTLSEYLREMGYFTAAVVSSVALGKSSNLDQGFDHYDDTLHEHSRPGSFDFPERTAPQVTSAAIKWLRENRERTFFLWVHYQDPHGPYVPEQPFKQRFVDEHAGDRERLDFSDDLTGHDGIPSYQRLGDRNEAGYYKSQYDGEIAFFDDSFGKLLNEMDDLDLLESSLIVFTADHGESLGEHGHYFAHGFYLYRELIRVPLIISWRGRKGVVQQPVQHIDILPTILGVLGFDGARVRGRNILRRSFPAQKIYSEIWRDRESIVDGKLSLIRVNKTEETSLFDMSDDPFQARNLANKPGFVERRDELLANMNELSRQDWLRLSESDAKLSPEEKEKLKALGYVE